MAPTLLTSFEGGVRQGHKPLGLTDTPYVVPVLPIVVVGIQTATIVVQVVTIRGIVRGRGPPVPVAGVVDGAIVVVAASNADNP